MTTLIELAAHVKEMRDLQTAYFASKKENRWGDKKLLAASKAKEAEVDGLVKEVLDGGYQSGKETGVDLITQERQEQIVKHGFTTDIDLKINSCSQLRTVAKLLITSQSELDAIDKIDNPIGRDKKVLFKLLEKAYKEQLVIAGALIAAEIDRLIAIEGKKGGVEG